MGAPRCTCGKRRFLKIAEAKVRSQDVFSPSFGRLTCIGEEARDCKPSILETSAHTNSVMSPPT